MCYNAGIELIDPLGAGFPAVVQANAMARPVAPVRTMAQPDRHLPMRWLLIPPGVDAATDLPRLKIWLANARLEELENKPLFKPLLRENRCIIRFSWFYEWRHEAQHKIKFRLALPGNTPMHLPGLFRETRIDGERYLSFTVCTMEARNVMRYIHNTRLRQPVVVGERGCAAWLDRKTSLPAARKTLFEDELSHGFVPDPPVQTDLFAETE